MRRLGEGCWGGRSRWLVEDFGVVLIAPAVGWGWVGEWVQGC